MSSPLCVERPSDKNILLQTWLELWTVWLILSFIQYLSHTCCTCQPSHDSVCCNSTVNTQHVQRPDVLVQQAYIWLSTFTFSFVYWWMDRAWLAANLKGTIPLCIVNYLLHQYRQYTTHAKGRCISITGLYLKILSMNPSTTRRIQQWCFSWRNLPHPSTIHTNHSYFRTIHCPFRSL